MSNVPGQMILPDLVETVGYETILLRPKWERFCWEYVLGKSDGKSAYLKVYPSAKERTARTNSARLLTNAAIILRIRQVREELRRRFEVTADDILAFLGQALTYDPRDFFDDDGKLLPIHQMPPEVVAIVGLKSYVDRQAGVMYLPTFPDKFKAAVELGRILGMYPETTRVSHHVGVTISEIRIVNPAGQLDSTGMLLQQIEETAA